MFVLMILGPENCPHPAHRRQMRSKHAELFKSMKMRLLVTLHIDGTLSLTRGSGITGTG